MCAVWYLEFEEDWRAKVERWGTVNYPAEARGKVYGNLRLTVTIRPDGNVDGIELDRSSGLKILDAAALMKLAPRARALAGRPGCAILTPHVGEMAAMLDCDAASVEADREGAVCRAAELYGSIVVLKGSTSLIADEAGGLFAYAGGGVGLATGGSGDVLAGIAAGLAARGTPPLDATLWAVWLHGEAGRRCAEQIGPLGYMARELLAHVPGLMRAI